MTENLENYETFNEAETEGIADEKLMKVKPLGEHNSDPKPEESASVSRSVPLEEASEEPESFEGGLEAWMENALARLQLLSGLERSKEMDNIIEVILPRILKNLKSYDAVYAQVREMDETMKSHLKNASDIDQDIGNMYMDLHELYRKLERIDAVKMEKSIRQILEQKVRDSEDLDKRNCHYVSHGTNTMDLPTNKPKSPTDDDEEIEAQVSSEESSSDAPKTQLELAERQTFLSNMLAIRKSDFSIELNRRNKYFKDYEKAINNPPEDSDDED